MTYIPATVGADDVDISVRAADVDNVTLATAVEDGDSFSGITLATGDVILLTGQFTASENGAWVVAASGAPARPSDFDVGAAASGVSFYVEEGWAATRRFVCSNPIASDTIDTNDLTIEIEGRVFRRTTEPFTAATNVTDGFFVGDVWLDEDQSDSRAWISSGADGGDSIWRRIGGGARQKVITGTSHTLVNDDMGDTLFFTNAATITITVNSATLLNANGSVTLVQEGAGQIQVTAGTMTRRVAARFNPHTNEQFSWMTVVVRTDAFIFGDLAAV